MSEKDVQLKSRKKYEKPELTKHEPLREVTVSNKCSGCSSKYAAGSC